MNVIRLSTVATCIVMSATAWAQSCSGGPDGGMDASGCQCNAPPEIVDQAAEHASSSVDPFALELDRAPSSPGVPTTRAVFHAKQE
jgi:hypothetical protein